MHRVSIMSFRVSVLAFVVGVSAVLAGSGANAQTSRAGWWTLALGVEAGASFRGREGDLNPFAGGLALRAGRTFAGAARFHLGVAMQYHPRAEGSLEKWLRPNALGVALDLAGDIPVWRLIVRPYVGLGALFAEVAPPRPPPPPPGGTPRYAVDGQSVSPLSLTVQPGVSVLWRHRLLLVGADVRCVVAYVGNPSVGAVVFSALLGLALD